MVTQSSFMAQKNESEDSRRLRGEEGVWEREHTEIVEPESERVENWTMVWLGLRSVL
jgi:phage terminase large subunit-like protein